MGSFMVLYTGIISSTILPRHGAAGGGADAAAAGRVIVGGRVSVVAAAVVDSTTRRASRRRTAVRGVVVHHHLLRFVSQRSPPDAPATTQTLCHAPLKKDVAFILAAPHGACIGTASCRGNSSTARVRLSVVSRRACERRRSACTSGRRRAAGWGNDLGRRTLDDTTGSWHR